MTVEKEHTNQVFGYRADRIVLGLLVLTTISLFGLAGYLVVSGVNDVEIVALLVNIGFYAFLVYLYIRMARSQDQQRQLMSRQTELMEAQHRPILDRGPVEVEGGVVNVSLMNSGNGPLADINLVTEIEIPDDCGYEPSIGVTPMSKRTPQGPTDSKIPAVDMGNSLKPDEGKMHFTGEPDLGLRCPSGEEIQTSFREGLEMLLEKEDSIDFEYKIFLEGRDLFGDSTRDLIIHRKIERVEKPWYFGELYEISDQVLDTKTK